jgi:hypothetical protein
MLLEEPDGKNGYCPSKLYTMNDAKVFVYFSGYVASSDLKHVAKFY